jgi:hypothetical protein
MGNSPINPLHEFVLIYLKVLVDMLFTQGDALQTNELGLQQDIALRSSYHLLDDGLLILHMTVLYLDLNWLLIFAFFPALQ